MPPKDQGPPGDSRSPNGHKKVALHERAKFSTAQQREQTLATALRYEVFGYRVIALRPGTRHPCYKGWTAPATTRPIRDQLARHPDADLAIVTGDGFFVLDVDTVEGHGRDGFASLAALEARYGKLPRTLTARTPSGGLHFYFGAPDDLPLPSSTSKIGDGLDIKGDRAFVKAPSTLQGDGEGRFWIDGGTRARAPQWLLDLVRSRGRRAISIDPALADMMAAAGRRGVSTDPDDQSSPQVFAEDDVPLKLTCALAVISADCGYGAWVRIGMAIYAGLGDNGFELFDAWSASAPKKYDPEIVRDKWVECAKVHSIRVATIYAIADQHDRRWRDDYAAALARRAA